ncbi:DNA-binding protein [Methanohalophilus sp.]|uniref:NOB1 family endonuclease n=1 Tax=Methanohalophilus sp. TaxID=1966352 RepID=UPI002602F5A1|nr:DNA-binding protein [Methanohalophilus sp.]MDK2891873.1 endoribonuclease Nob1 [Methanohalophilus sp.]
MLFNPINAYAKDMKIFVADTAVFINRYRRDATFVTVPSVIEELKSRESSIEGLLAIESGAKVEQPNPEAIAEIHRMARNTRDIEELSKTDIEILAKAFEYKDNAILLTDDYAMQNVALLLGIEVKPVTQKKIKDRIIWEKRCTGCRRKFDSGDECPVCGSPLKKTRKRKV